MNLSGDAVLIYRIMIAVIYFFQYRFQFYFKSIAIQNYVPCQLTTDKTALCLEWKSREIEAVIVICQINFDSSLIFDMMQKKQVMVEFPLSEITLLLPL